VTRTGRLTSRLKSSDIEVGAADGSTPEAGIRDQAGRSGGSNLLLWCCRRGSRTAMKSTTPGGHNPGRRICAPCGLQNCRFKIPLLRDYAPMLSFGEALPARAAGLGRGRLLLDSPLRDPA